MSTYGGGGASDIRSLSRQQIVTAVQEIKSNFKQAKFVMIVDQASIPILSSLFRTVELMEYNIVLLERYDLKRQPLPAYHAIYFLSPKTSLQVMIDDFSGSKPMYAAPHILFTYPCDNSILKPLESVPHVVDRILTLKFLFLQFTSTDPTTFYTNTSNAFQTMYDPGKANQFTAAADHMVAGLASFFFNIKTQPSVAFVEDNDSLASVVASKFTAVMENTVKTLPQNQQSSISKNSLLLIFGRGNDPSAPLLHSLTYEAELYDHFRPENNVIVPNPNYPDQRILLNGYEDEKYVELRYADPLELPQLAEKLRTEVEEALGTKKDDASLQERMEFNRRQVKYVDMKNRNSAHYDAIDVISTQRKKKNIQDFVPFEQSLATGLQYQKDSAFKPEGAELSQKLLQAVDKQDKIRLIALFQLGTKRFKDDALVRMMNVGGIEPEWKKVFDNVSRLCPEEESKRIPRGMKRPKNEDANWDRYIPLVYEVVKNIYDGKKLHKGMEKYIALPEHSGRYQSITVFMMGGITPMELRWLGKLRKEMRGVKLYVGSSNILSARSYLAQLKTMSG